MFNRNTILLYLISLSLILADKDVFSLKSKTENNFFIEFKLDDYSIKKINEKNQIFLDNDSLLIEDNFFFSTLLQIDLNQDYNINFEQGSVESYDFENSIYSTNSSESYYNVREHIIRGRKLIEITLNPFNINNDMSLDNFSLKKFPHTLFN